MTWEEWRHRGHCITPASNWCQQARKAKIHLSPDTNAWTLIPSRISGRGYKISLSVSLPALSQAVSPCNKAGLNTLCWNKAARRGLGWVSDPPFSMWQCTWDFPLENLAIFCRPAITNKKKERTGMLLSIAIIIATWRKGDLRPNQDPSQRLYSST